VLGVDEHVWRHTRRGDKYVTVVIDLTPIRDSTDPARLLDTVGAGQRPRADLPCRSSQVVRDTVEVVAMDGFTGFKTAAAEEVPEAVVLIDPFHDALDRYRRRVQLATCGHRGRASDPLYKPC
jgi:transposase